MKINISPELKATIELCHSKVRDGYERDCIRTVLLRPKGWKRVRIAQALRINKTVISDFYRQLILSFLFEMQALYEVRLSF